MQIEDTLEKEICWNLANNLESIKSYKLQNTDIAHKLADYIYRSNVRDMAQLDGLVRSLLANQSDKAGNNQSVTELTPDTLLTSSFLAEKITPWIETIRTELFGSPTVPFKNVTNSEQWIKQQEHLEPSLDYDAMEPLLKMVYAFKEQHYPIDFQVGYPSFPYLGSDGRLNFAKIARKAPQDWSMPQMREDYRNYSKLNWLENEIRIMTRATGFTQPSLTQFALTGTEPILPRYKSMSRRVYQSLPSGEQMQLVHVSIDINAKDLTFEELRRLYNDFRELLQLKKHRLREGVELVKSHIEIYQFVKANGGPLEGKGTVKHWESMKGKWNNSHPQDKHYATWKGIKLAYDRIIRKLEDRVMEKGRHNNNERTHSEEE